MSDGLVHVPTLREVAMACSRITGLRPSLIYGPTRKADVVRARYVIWWICRNHLLKGYPFIGRTFFRDHTTIYHGVQKLNHLLELGTPWVIEIIDRMEKELGMSDDRVVNAIIDQWEERTNRNERPSKSAVSGRVRVRPTGEANATA
jgi:nucleoside-diphosphate-sugar epimerase